MNGIGIVPDPGTEIRISRDAANGSVQTTGGSTLRLGELSWKVDGGFTWDELSRGSLATDQQAVRDGRHRAGGRGQGPRARAAGRPGEERLRVQAGGGAEGGAVGRERRPGEAHPEARGPEPVPRYARHSAAGCVGVRDRRDVHRSGDHLERPRLPMAGPGADPRVLDRRQVQGQGRFARVRLRAAAVRRARHDRVLEPGAAGRAEEPRQGDHGRALGRPTRLPGQEALGQRGAARSPHRRRVLPPARRPRPVHRDRQEGRPRRRPDRQRGRVVPAEAPVRHAVQRRARESRRLADADVPVRHRGVRPGGQVLRVRYQGALQDLRHPGRRRHDQLAQRGADDRRLARLHDSRQRVRRPDRARVVREPGRPGVHVRGERRGDPPGRPPFARHRHRLEQGADALHRNLERSVVRPRADPHRDRPLAAARHLRLRPRPRPRRGCRSESRRLRRQRHRRDPRRHEDARSERPDP